ncbi:MAG TPA: zinc-dependent metalloprotease family protein [Flavipsychrobacter sp.]|nr:zinc-dependent metalloprotease family protein [Flavipsychrobacter sp.]
MKQLSLTLLILITFIDISYAFDKENIWQQTDTANIQTKGARLLYPDHYLVYSLNTSSLQSQLSVIPDNPANAEIIPLPMPDGTFMDFKIWQSHIMSSEMEARYSEIKTYTAYAVGNQNITAKIDFTLRGFHAMIYNGNKTSFIDPYSDVNDGHYICYYSHDYSIPLNERMHCDVKDNDQLQSGERIELNKTGLPSLQRLVNGNKFHTYRLALSCTGEYADTVCKPLIPTKALVLSAMTTSMNRVNGVYERELAVTMKFVNKEDTLIILNPAGEPFTNDYGSAMLGQNQNFVDSLIGDGNYDIGHVFSTGGGGVSQIGVVCKSSLKAQGVTGSASPVGDAFDIDYVAHEMGHEFGANHSFNDNSQGSCAGNAEFPQAYEPGSGSTIMCYAGICDPDNLQQHSDAYFHAIGLRIISNYVNVSTGSTCGTTTTSGNKGTSMPSFSAKYFIPYYTPFELTAPTLVDSVSDTLNTYCWEEWDLGDFGATFADTHFYGPIFRSFSPDTSRTRVFPKLTQLLSNITDYEGEKLPDTDRNLLFKLTVRDIFDGIGCFTIPDDSILLKVVNTGAPFSVTSPNTSGTVWVAKSSQVVKWNVANTTSAPINCDSVDIYLSIDGGYTYPYLLTSTPNDGIDTITVPDVYTPMARIKVKGRGNVFFNISSQNFTINWPLEIGNISWADNISIFPVPANNLLNITADGKFQIIALNDIGQVKWEGNMSDKLTIPVNNWTKGIYYIQLSNEAGQRAIKPVVIK